MDALCEAGENKAYANLTDLLLGCGEAAYQVSEEINATYFTHSGEAGQSLGA